MSTAISPGVSTLPPFKNEPYADFTKPDIKAAMEGALAKVRAELSKDYALLIDGERVKTGDLLKSVNPSRPSEVVGLHHKATAELATKAIEGAHA